MLFDQQRQLVQGDDIFILNNARGNRCCQAGMMNRVVAKTNKNHTSSRSHATGAAVTNGKNGGRIAKVNDRPGRVREAGSNRGVKNGKSRPARGLLLICLS